MYQYLEWINPSLPREFRTVIFDFDGTLSLIRQGWHEVMVDYMVEVLKQTPKVENEAKLRHVVREFVDKLTGKQTIYQMIQLADEVTKRGGIPADPLDYKHEYHDRLMTKIGHRITGLRNGQIEPKELLVPGSIELLASLREQEMTMYLASGTDLKYVLDEADALGIACFFEDRIYGALDDYRKFSKAMVIQQILRENELEGTGLLGFGDGYVEIQEVKAVGAMAVGVASNEDSRTGVNEWKRRRLVDAGADLIIPDYHKLDRLLRALLVE